MERKKITVGSAIQGRSNSFVYAGRGIARLIRQEANARIHLIATVAVIIAGFIRHLSPTQWLAITFAIGFVWVTEGLNTAIEMLCNIWCNNQYHETVKHIKDISAGAVLIASLVSVVTGVIVFFF